MPHTWDPNSLSPGVLGPAQGGEQSLSRSRASPRPTHLERDPRHPGPEPLRDRARLLGLADAGGDSFRSEGFGYFFVVRIAGNIAAPSGVGSVEFAASLFGTRLVVVMGHTQCGAISATIEAIETGLGPESKNIRSITDCIAPHLLGLVALAGGKPEMRAALLREAMRANIRASCESPPPRQPP